MKRLLAAAEAALALAPYARAFLLGVAGTVMNWGIGAWIFKALEVCK